MRLGVVAELGVVARPSSARNREFGSRLSQTKNLKMDKCRFLCQALGIIGIGQGLVGYVRKMRLSGISGLGAGGFVSQWASTIIISHHEFALSLVLI